MVGASRETVGGIAITVLNTAIRPFLAKWHPLLSAWEMQRDVAKVSVRDHERAWEKDAACRRELEQLQRGMVAYARELAKIAGAG